MFLCYKHISGHIVDMAEKYGGLIFGVEHRFYGLSTFESCLDNYNLTFLSSPQAYVANHFFLSKCVGFIKVLINFFTT